MIVFLQLSHTWTLPIGSLVVPIRELLSEQELVLDQWFHLDGASPESQVLLRAQLKVGEFSVNFSICLILNASRMAFKFPFICPFISFTIWMFFSFL